MRFVHGTFCKNGKTGESFVSWLKTNGVEFTVDELEAELRQWLVSDNIINTLHELILRRKRLDLLKLWIE